MSILNNMVKLIYEVDEIYLTIFRYRIKIRVMDSSDSTTFVLFDRDATTLFKKTCADMLDAHDKVYSSIFPLIYLITQCIIIIFL